MKRTPSRLVVVASLALLASPIGSMTAQSKTAAAKPDPLQGLAEYIEQVRTAWRIPGVAVGIVKDDSLIFARGFGLRELGKPDSVDARTIFAIGSNTKSFTSTAAAILVDEGKLHWTDKVTKWLPWFQLNDLLASRDLNLRDVMSHRSGLGRRGDALWYGTSYSREEILRRIRFLTPNAPFRTEMGYQNIMFLAAGEVVGKAAGMSYDDVIRQRIFAPLGMTSSRVSLKDLASQSDVSTPHSIGDEAVSVIPWRNIDNVGPAGSITSNVEDMAQYLRFHLGNGTYRGTKIVGPVNLGMTKTPQINIGGVGDSLTHFSAYGLGWVLLDYRGKKIAWHNGGIDGMLSEMWTVPEAGLGIVVLTNGSPHAAGPAIVWNIVDRFLMGAPTKDYLAEGLKQRQQARLAIEAQQKTLEAARAKDSKPSLPLERYAGRYSDQMYGDVQVTVEGGRLVFTYQSFKVPLDHWQYNTFKESSGIGLAGRQLVTFQIDANGKVGRADVEGLSSFIARR